MKLYGSYTSPFVRHCRIVLLDKKLDCEFIEADHAVSAVKSPTKKMPFLEDGEIFLTDSTAIVKYFREKAGEVFCHDITTFDHLCLVNTLLDASVCLFMLEKDAIKPEQSIYLQRHEARVQSGLAELDNMSWPDKGPYNDLELRLLCYLDWALFRQRFTFDQHRNLTTFLATARQYPHFAQTSPQA